MSDQRLRPTRSSGPSQAAPPQRDGDSSGAGPQTYFTEPRPNFGSEPSTGTTNWTSTPRATEQKNQNYRAPASMYDDPPRGKTLLTKIIIGVAVVIGLVVLALGTVHLSSQGGFPFLRGEDQTPPINLGLLQNRTPFDGTPVPLKWPVDIRPIRMDIHLDPVTSEPVLILVGERDGVGTVIRAHNREGELIGMWVVVPEATAPQQPAPQQPPAGGN